MVYNFFDKGISNTNKGRGVNSDMVAKNKKLAEELHKQIIRNFTKRKVHWSCIDNIWGCCSSWYTINQ